MPLEGKLVILREERDEDVPIFQALRNNLETQAWPKTLPPDYTLGMYMRRPERDFSLTAEMGGSPSSGRRTARASGTSATRTSCRAGPPLLASPSIRTTGARVLPTTRLRRC